MRKSKTFLIEEGPKNQKEITVNILIAAEGILILFHSLPRKSYFNTLLLNTATECR